MNSPEDPKPSSPSEASEEGKACEEPEETMEESSEVIEDDQSRNLNSKNEEEVLKTDEQIEEKSPEALESKTDTKSMENSPKTDENPMEMEISVVKNDKSTPPKAANSENSSISPEKITSIVKNNDQPPLESKPSEKSLKTLEPLENDEDIDEVVLDSTEDEEVCEIVHSDLNKSRDTESQDDICVLNDEISDTLKPDAFLDLLEIPQDKPEVDPNEMLILPDSDSDTENYLTNIKPKIETEGFPVTETLQLTFEETFFLMYGLGCLQVVNYDGQFFSIIEAWNHFNEQDEGFFSKYVVYHYFRSKGWVVRPGIKCSGDFGKFIIKYLVTLILNR